jgi:hypothetical protein
MKNDLRNQLLQREMTRKEFLQWVAGACAILLGFGNLLSLLTRYSKTEEKTVQATDRHGFGSRKFGA